MKKITILGISLIISLFSFSAKAEINFDLMSVGGTLKVDYAYASSENAKPQADRWITMNVASGTSGKCDDATNTFDIKSGRPIEFHLAKCDEMVITANVATTRSLVITIDGGEPTKYAGTGSCNNFVIPINKEEPVVIKVEGEGGSTWTSFFTFKYAAKTPQISSFKINGIAADIDESTRTITIVMPYGTDISNVTPEITLGGTAVSYSPTGAQNFTTGTIKYMVSAAIPPPAVYNVNVSVKATPDTEKSITSLTINGKNAVINDAAGTITYEFASFEGPLGNWVVNYELNSITAKADFSSGASHDFGANNTLTITVTAQDNSTKVYSVKPTISTKKNVGILTVNGKAESYDNLLLSALSNYYISFLKAEATAPTDIQAFYANYDLVVLHSNVGGTNATAVASKAIVGVKPILNMKVFFYNSGRWSWSAANPGNAAAGTTTVTVPAEVQSHPIFAGAVFDGTTLSIYDNLPATNSNAVQYASDLDNISPLVSHTLAFSGETGINIHEIQNNLAAKFIMLGWSMENNNYTYFNTNALNIIKNTAAYLLDASAKYNYDGSSTNINKISTFYFNGNSIYNPTQKSLRIFNTSGVSLKESKESIVDINKLPHGVYIIKADNETLKIVK